MVHSGPLTGHKSNPSHVNLFLIFWGKYGPFRLTHSRTWEQIVHVKYYGTYTSVLYFSNCIFFFLLLLYLQHALIFCDRIRCSQFPKYWLLLLMEIGYPFFKNATLMGYLDNCLMKKNTQLI